MHASSASRMPLVTEPKYHSSLSDVSRDPFLSQFFSSLTKRAVKSGDFASGMKERQSTSFWRKSAKERDEKRRLVPEKFSCMRASAGEVRSMLTDHGFSSGGVHALPACAAPVVEHVSPSHTHDCKRDKTPVKLVCVPVCNPSGGREAAAKTTRR